MRSDSIALVRNTKTLGDSVELEINRHLYLLVSLLWAIQVGH